MRQYHFDFYCFSVFGSDFLNSFSNPFIVHPGPSFLFEPNLPFFGSGFLFTCGILTSIFCLKKNLVMVKKFFANGLEILYSFMH